MAEQRKLTDRTALRRNRNRAQAAPDFAGFLHDEAFLEVQERLNLVNRTFTSPAVVTGWPQIWGKVVPQARICADTETLDLGVGQHDLIVHAMSLHWADDPIGQLIQCRRALQPDGLLLAVLFGGQTLHELRASLAEAEINLSSGLSPRVLPMAEIRDLGGLLQRAGFALPVADSLIRQVSYQSAFHLMRDLRAMGEANALCDRPRSFAKREIFSQAAQIYERAFSLADNRIGATFELICLTGWAPADNQPQPLRPGSAQSRLADALGTQETRLPNTNMPQQD